MKIFGGGINEKHNRTSARQHKREERSHPGINTELEEEEDEEKNLIVSVRGGDGKMTPVDKTSGRKILKEERMRVR